MEVLGLTLDVIGKILVAYMALRVHHRFWQEHKIDDKVFADMKREQVIGLFGIILIIVGFVFQLTTKI